MNLVLFTDCFANFFGSVVAQFVNLKIPLFRRLASSLQNRFNIVEYKFLRFFDLLY